MPYGTSHSSTLPTVGVTVGPTYATQINAAIAEIRATVDALVTPAGIEIDDDLSFLSSGTYYGAVDLSHTQYENKTVTLSAAAYPATVFVLNGELYYNDTSSQQVQLTDAGSVNVSSAGGITGAGYGAAGVEVNWDAGTTEYRMRSGSLTNDYGDVKCDDVLFNDGSGNFLRMTAAAMASDFTVTWPAAVPGSTLPLLMDSSGVISASGTLANLVSFTTSGSGTVGTTLGVTGLITASAGLTAAAGQHVTVSTTGRFKHGEMQRMIPISASNNSVGGSQPFIFGGGADAGSADPFGIVFMIPLVFDVGERITALDLFAIYDTGDAKTMILVDSDGSASTTSTGAVTTDFGPNAGYTLSLSGLTTTVTDGHSYHVLVDGGAAAGDRVFHLRVTYDRP